MKERPIIMTGHSPVATKEGRKTQTRRVVRPQPRPYRPGPLRHPAKHPAPYFDSYCSEAKTPANPRGMSTQWCWWSADDRPAPDTEVRCPYGVPGDRLWVKEPWAIAHDHIAPAYAVKYLADGEVRPGLGDHFPKARSSMFMPRWASRLLLEVTRVRVELVKEISYEDILAEGIEWPKDTGGKTNREVALATFEALWNKINAKRGYGWNDNPWVFVISYKVIEGLAPAASHSV